MKVTFVINFLIKEHQIFYTQMNALFKYVNVNLCNYSSLGITNDRCVVFSL